MMLTISYALRPHHLAGPLCVAGTAARLGVRRFSRAPPRRPSAAGLSSLTFINHRPWQVVVGPGRIFDLRDELRPTRRLYNRPAHILWYKPRMTTIGTLRMVLLCLSLLSVPLAVKAQTTCMNCYKAFPCSQKYKECTNSCKVYPFGDDSRITCDKSCQPMLTECIAAARNRCGYWCTP